MGSYKSTRILFNEALFWVCIYDLALIAKNENIGNLIGKTIERVEEVDIDKGEMAWGLHMCV